MKLISDIRENVELLHTMNRHAMSELDKKYKPKIFAYYDECKEIQELLNKRDTPEDYKIDECGELVSYVTIPEDILALPEIKDYLSQEYGYVRDDELTQFHGPYISIDWNHERNSYFVYDTESRHPIIDKREEWMDEIYVGAVIAEFQTHQGVFNDIIEICSRYGSYQGHFKFDALLKRVNNLEDEKGITEVIREYRFKHEEE